MNADAKSGDVIADYIERMEGERDDLLVLIVGRCGVSRDGGTVTAGVEVQSTKF